MTLTVGQTLWYVPHQRYESGRDRGTEVTVIKVGRKWADLNRGIPRISIQTMQADGGQYSSPGRCYLSRDEWLAEITLNAIWRDFASRIGGQSPPDGVTEDAIRQAAELLHIPMFKKTDAPP